MGLSRLEHGILGYMKKNVLITGMPKSGKSTLLRKLIADVPDKVGFVTNEMLGEQGRVGFEIETHGGHKATLAHVDLETGAKVSKYFVEIDNLESLIPEVSSYESGDILYLDEIGEMQLFSKKFEELVLQYLDSSNTCLATISSVYENEFARAIKTREDVNLIELTPENREEIERVLRGIMELWKK